MDIDQILDAMENTAVDIFERNEDYAGGGKRGVLAAYVRNAKNKNQWDGSSRSFGESFRDYSYEDELVIDNGVNFDGLVHGKIAFSRRAGKDSGTNYYQVLGQESWWKGAVVSDDGRCICAFAGFSGEDDRAIAFAGIAAYESQKPDSGDDEGALAKTGSFLKAASLTRTGEEDADGEAGGTLPAKAAQPKKTKSKADKKPKKGK
jgi:hypothetical protein